MQATQCKQASWASMSRDVVTVVATKSHLAGFGAFLARWPILHYQCGLSVWLASVCKWPALQI